MQVCYFYDFWYDQATYTNWVLTTAMQPPSTLHTEQHLTDMKLQPGQYKISKTTQRKQEELMTNG